MSSLFYPNNQSVVFILYLYCEVLPLKELYLGAQYKFVQKDNKAIIVPGPILSQE